MDFALLTMGGSRGMEPFVDGRAYLAIDMNAYRRAKPKRWEAVVFDLKHPTSPGRAGTVNLSRVMGLPGETVSIENGTVYIDGQPLQPSAYEPPHLRNVAFDLKVPNGEIVPHPYKVPDGCYYVLGDNPAAAVDSRTLGALPEAEILSRYPTRPQSSDP